MCNSVGRNTVQQPHSANTWAQSKLLRPSFNQQVLSQKVCCCVAAWLTCCLRTVPLPDLLHRYAANRTSKNITIELSKATFARFGTLQYGKTSFKTTTNQQTNSPWRPHRMDVSKNEPLKSCPEMARKYSTRESHKNVQVSPIVRP